MRLFGLTVLVLLALCVPAQAKVTCGDGTTAFVDGTLRIFGVHYRTSDEQGFEEYACLGRRMKPLYVGGVGSDTGVGSADTPVYAHNRRYLASYSQSDGEGGPGADVRVVDLLRRRTVSFANLACCEWTPALRLVSNGTVAVLSPGEGLFVKAPGRKPRTFAAEGAGARDLAMFGGTVYWTEGGQAHSTGLPGADGGEAYALEPVRLHRRGGPCAAARGRTLVASGSVRVYETPGGRRSGTRGARRACRIGGRKPFALAGSTPPRIVADRWLLAFGEGSARVIDMRTGQTVTHEQSVARATLLADGTLAWLDFGGRLLARGPGADAVVLSENAPGLLAAARRAVYWTENGVPRVYRPPGAARSALARMARAKVRCGDGVLLFAEPQLRMFAVPWRSEEEWGADHYACWEGRRPFAVGRDYSNTGTGSDHTLAYAHAGRFLASYHQTDGEGGPSAHVSVVDLVRRRSVSFANVACCEGTPPLRLAPDGTLAVLAPGEGVFVKSPGRRARTLAGEGARDLALYGGTVYWSEGGQARSATLDGVTGGEALMLEPVRVRRRDGCAAARGRTIVASGSVRVFDQGDERFACRIGRRGKLPLFGITPPRIVGDRWLLVLGEGHAGVLDTRTGRFVIDEESVAIPTLLGDGTLVWIDYGGDLLARSPGADIVRLAESQTGAPVAVPAAARRAVYWTENGIARVYRPPSAARSASKPG